MAITSQAYSVEYQSKNGAYQTFTVGYSSLHPDSPFNHAMFADLVAGDQVDYSATSSPDGFDVSIAGDGLLSISFPGGVNVSQDVTIEIIDASANYARQVTQTLTIEPPSEEAEVFATLENITGSIVADNTQTIEASVNTLLGDITGSVSATMTNPSIVSATLDGVSSSINATIHNHLSLSATLENVTGAVIVDNPQEVVLSATLGDVTGSLSAAIPNPAVINATLGDVTAAINLYNAEFTTVSVSATLGEVTSSISSSNVEPYESHVNATLDDVTSSISVQLTNPSSVLTTLDNVTSSISATLTNPALVNATLGDVTASLDVSNIEPTGLNVSATLGDVTASLSLSNVPPNNSSISATLGEVSASVELDNEPRYPTISLIGGDVVRYVDTGFSEPGYSADDGYGVDITDDVIRTGSVDTSTPGVYPLQYNVTSVYGRAAETQTRNVTIVVQGSSGSTRPLKQLIKRSLKGSLRKIL